MLDIPSDEAMAVARESEIIDLHIDSFIPHRLWGYDLFARHDKGLLRGRFFGHLDLPRLEDGALDGGMWSITTNPFRRARGRWKTLVKNIERMKALVASSKGSMRLVNNPAEYRQAREDGAHAIMLSIQGGNALDASPDGLASIQGQGVLRVTVVHLTNSSLGTSSSPHHRLRKSKELSPDGAAFIEQCNEGRVFVDLAHIHEEAFWQAVDIHDREQPLIVTHTGVDGVRPHWRNLSDRQIKAVADSGGVIGIIFANNFLRPLEAQAGGRRAENGSLVVQHMEHVMKVGGDGAVAIGSDFDGAIVPLPDLKGADSYPRLVQHMLERGWTREQIEGALGKNFLRSFERLRPGAAG